MAYDLASVLVDLGTRKASDGHLKVKTPVYFRVLDELQKTDHPVPEREDLEGIARSVLAPEDHARLERSSQVDTIYSLESHGLRFRVSFFTQRGTLGMVVREIPKSPPPLEDIGFPSIAREMLGKHRGMILVTGPSGSGKTTTAASIISHFNTNHEHHIVTLEDPIEYNLESVKSMITQREVGEDTKSFASGLRQVLRQDPDIIYVGELRDLDTVGIAVAAAETGHLVLSTLHTPDTATTIEQLIGMYPANQQAQVRIQISITLQGILSQVLLPRADRTGRIAAFEVMNPSDGMRNLVRQNQTFRILDMMETTGNCQSMKKGLQELVRKRLVTAEDAKRHERRG